MLPEHREILSKFTWHLSLRPNWSGPTSKYVRWQVSKVHPDITPEQFEDVWLEWINQPVSYPITEEQKVQMGFCSVQEARRMHGIDLDESHLTYVNSWAYSVYCALCYIGGKLKVKFQPMRFIEFRDMVLKVSLINQGLIPAGRSQYSEPVPEQVKVARSKMFTSQVIPHPIDGTAAKVTGL